MTKQAEKLIKIEILQIIVTEIVELNNSIDTIAGISTETQYWLNRLAQRLLLRSGEILNEDD